MKKAFRIVRAKPTNKAELFKMYISMIKNITCQEFILTTRTGKQKTSTYKLNVELIKFHVELNQYSNNYLTNYDADTLKMLDITKPQRKKNEAIKEDEFIDSDDDNDIKVVKKSNTHHLDNGIEEC